MNTSHPDVERRSVYHHAAGAPIGLRPAGPGEVWLSVNRAGEHLINVDALARAIDDIVIDGPID